MCRIGDAKKAVEEMKQMRRRREDICREFDPASMSEICCLIANGESRSGGCSDDRSQLATLCGCLVC